jgi:hypothetical protein
MFYEAAKHFYTLEKVFLLIFYHRVPPKMTTEKRGFFWPWPIWDARFRIASTFSRIDPSRRAATVDSQD